MGFHSFGLFQFNPSAKPEYSYTDDETILMIHLQSRIESPVRAIKNLNQRRISIFLRKGVPQTFAVKSPIPYEADESETKTNKRKDHAPINLTCKKKQLQKKKTEMIKKLKENEGNEMKHLRVLKLKSARKQKKE